jgi:transcriptional regulator of met regulon
VSVGIYIYIYIYIYIPTLTFSYSNFNSQYNSRQRHVKDIDLPLHEFLHAFMSAKLPWSLQFFKERGQEAHVPLVLKKVLQNSFSGIQSRPMAMGMALIININRMTFRSLMVAALPAYVFSLGKFG